MNSLRNYLNKQRVELYEELLSVVERISELSNHILTDDTEKDELNELTFKKIKLESKLSVVLEVLEICQNRRRY